MLKGVPPKWGIPESASHQFMAITPIVQPLLHTEFKQVAQLDVLSVLQQPTQLLMQPHNPIVLPCSHELVELALDTFEIEGLQPFCPFEQILHIGVVGAPVVDVLQELLKVLPDEPVELIAQPLQEPCQKLSELFRTYRQRFEVGSEDYGPLVTRLLREDLLGCNIDAASGLLPQHSIAGLQLPQQQVSMRKEQRDCQYLPIAAYSVGCTCHLCQEFRQCGPTLHNQEFP